MSNHTDNDNIAWPEKTGEFYHNHFDSTFWNDFPFRDDDIIISTYAKSGTTWVQQILAQLIFNGATDLTVAEMSHLPNLMLLHFSALKADMPGQIRRIAAFLDIPVDESQWDAIIEHCSFDYMRAHAELSVPLGGAAWEGGAKTFIHKGTNGRWRDVLTEEDIANYESRALEELGPECADWLSSGEL
jgi:hypothetical protein